MLRDVSTRSRRTARLSALAAMAAAVPLGIFVLSGSSEAAVAPVADGVYTLANGSSGKCLNTSGTVLVQIACSTTTASQLWKATAAGSNFTMVNSASSQCVNGTAAAVQATQSACGTATTQQWTFTASTGAAGKYLIKNVSTGLCLTNKDASTAGNNPILAQACSDVSQSQWSFNYVSGPTGAPSPTPCTGPSTPPVTTPPASTTINVWMAGDSTMAYNGTTCPIGWGAEFDAMFHSNVVVNNLAVSGRSIQTWMYEAGVSATMNSAGECPLTSTTPSTNWQKTLNGMKAGDYLFIQFGINDGATTCPKHVGGARYQQLMTTMANTAKAKGVTPVLLTPVAAIACSGSTATLNRGYYPETFAAGTATSSPVIDLRTLSVNYYNSIKLCPNDGTYGGTNTVGLFFCNDHTHFEAYGARRIMRLVTGALTTQKIALAGSLL